MNEKEVRKYFGKKFYKQKDGYWANMMPIHAQRWVWINHHGAIPKGYDIHHKDGDKSNNEINNLEILTRSEHLKRHWKEGRFDIDQRRKQLAEARKWTQTHEGRKKISQTSLDSWKAREKVTLSCKNCGKQFQGFYTKTQACSERCYYQMRRIKQGNPVKFTRKQIPKTCVRCGAGFSASLSYALYCSLKCRRKKIK